MFVGFQTRGADKEVAGFQAVDKLCCYMIFIIYNYQHPSLFYFLNLSWVINYVTNILVNSEY